MLTFGRMIRSKCGSSPGARYPRILMPRTPIPLHGPHLPQCSAPPVVILQSASMITSWSLIRPSVETLRDRSSLTLVALEHVLKLLRIQRTLLSPSGRSTTSLFTTRRHGHLTTIATHFFVLHVYGSRNTPPVSDSSWHARTHLIHCTFTNLRIVTFRNHIRYLSLPRGHL